MYSFKQHNIYFTCYTWQTWCWFGGCGTAGRWNEFPLVHTCIPAFTHRHACRNIHTVSHRATQPTVSVCGALGADRATQPWKRVWRHNRHTDKNHMQKHKETHANNFLFHKQICDKIFLSFECVCVCYVICLLSDLRQWLGWKNLQSSHYVIINSY